MCLFIYQLTNHSNNDMSSPADSADLGQKTSARPRSIHIRMYTHLCLSLSLSLSGGAGGSSSVSGKVTPRRVGRKTAKTAKAAGRSSQRLQRPRRLPGGR